MKLLIEGMHIVILMWINIQSQGVSKNVCGKFSQLVRILRSILVSTSVYDLSNVNSLLIYTHEFAVDYYLTGHILPAA